MPKKTGEHLFKKSDKIASQKRDDLIARWLDPDSPDTKVRHGVAPTFEELAGELSLHLETYRPLSEGAVRQYVRALRSNGTNLVTRRRGRPATAKQVDKQAVPMRPRGRPKKEAVRTDKEALQETKNLPLRYPTKAFDVTFLAQLTAEAIQLTGLPPNALHKAFSDQTTWKSFLGERSSFFYRLQKKLSANHLAGDKSSLRPDIDLYHCLRLHQVTLLTLDDLRCVVLFAYEPRSHFLNAACYVAHPNITDRPKGRLSGRPVKQFHPTWRMTCATEDGQPMLHLPAEALLEFAMETRALMGIPVDTVWLSSSLGKQAALIPQLQQLAPEDRFLPIPGQHQPFIPPEAGKSIRVTALCRQLEEVLNNHYQELAFAKLDEYQSRIDKRIEEVFEIRQPASGRQRYKQRKLITILGESDASKARRQEVKELTEFRTSLKVRLHVRHCLSIAPVHLSCDAPQTTSQSSSADQGETKGH